MTVARDIMRPAVAIVHVEHTLAEALVRIRDTQWGYLIAVDGDEAVGVLDRRLIDGIDAEDHVSRSEMVGNLMSLAFRTCRLDDGIEDVRRLFERSEAVVVAVTDVDRQVHGLIAPDDIGLAPRHVVDFEDEGGDEREMEWKEDSLAGAPGPPTPPDTTKTKSHTVRPHFRRRRRQ